MENIASVEVQPNNIIESEASVEPQFSEYFPKLYHFICSDTIDEIIKHASEQPEAGMHDAYPRLKEEVFEPCYEELKILGNPLEEWIECRDCHLHLIMVVYNWYHDDRFSKLSESHQNQLLWAALLHDIGKRGGLPKWFEGKDHIHPFRSAGFLLQIFAENKIIKEEYYERAIKLGDLVLNANVEITDKKLIKRYRKKWDTLCHHIHDHSKLADIFYELKKISEHNQFIINTFVVVLFHQSLHGIKCYRPMVTLSDDDIRKYIPEDSLDLLEIIMSADSHAYTKIGVSSETVSKYNAEISAEIGRIKYQFYDK